MPPASERGRAFESEVATLLHAGGFRVAMNAGAARPRQTDVYAQCEGLDLLVEAKSRRRKVGVEDVEDLRARLRRTAADVVGVIFTTSDITRGAIEAIEMDRTREVLVFVGSEINLLHAGRQNLVSLIKRKRQELRVQGKAWFGAISHAEFLGVKLPPSGTEFRVREKAVPYFAFRTRSAHASYTLHMPDPGWGAAGGEGALLQMRLMLDTVQDLRNILGYLHTKFGLSSNGIFSIHQSDICWHGVGAETLVQAIENWKQRYAQSQVKTAHHSEEISYFDQFRNGWLALSLQHRLDWRRNVATRGSVLHGSELAIQLPGVPIDIAPFLDLARYTRNDWAQFEYVGQRMTHRRRLRKSIVLKVIGVVVSRVIGGGGEIESDRVVTGVIAENPFYCRRALPRELQCDELLPLHELLAMELLLCSVRDWHDEGDDVDHYILEGFEVTQTNVTQWIRPFGTWNQIVKRAAVRHASNGP